MAVIPASVKFRRLGGATGRTEREGGNSYTAVWQCECDNPSDQAGVVLAYFRANVADIYDPYSGYGNDPSDPLAVVQSIEPRPLGNNCGQWEVVYEFSEYDVDLDQDEGGNPTDNPLDWAPTLDIGTIIEQEQVQKATYKGGYTTFPYAADSEIRPMSSATQVYINPPVYRDSNRGRLIFGKNYLRGAANIEAIKQWENYVNSLPFTFALRGYTGTYAAEECKIREIILSSGRFRSVDYAIIRWVIEQAPRRWDGTAWKRTWRDCIADAGTLKLVAGELKPITRTADDGTEYISTEPQPLDGSGMPADTAAADPIQVIGQWEKYELTDFTAIPLLSDILKTPPP